MQAILVLFSQPSIVHSPDSFAALCKDSVGKSLGMENMGASPGKRAQGLRRTYGGASVLWHPPPAHKWKSLAEWEPGFSRWGPWGRRVRPVGRGRRTRAYPRLRSLWQVALQHSIGQLPPVAFAQVPAVVLVPGRYPGSGVKRVWLSGSHGWSPAFVGTRVGRCGGQEHYR